MYETVYETDTMADDPYNSPKEYLQYTKTYKPILSEILHDLSSKPITVTSDMLRKARNQGKPDPLQNLGFSPDNVSMANLHGLSNKMLKKMRFGQYVDVTQTEELTDGVKQLIYKLKELYFTRKIKPQKGKKKTQAPKKRYIIGLNEIRKNIRNNQCNMIILATNIEEVGGEFGLN
jgi:hypothetical protein